MKTQSGMKCSNCGFWNSIEVNKHFVEQEASDPKVKAFKRNAKKVLQLNLKH
jgi:predicted ATP-dependent serine protease